MQGHENITFLQGAYEDRQAVHLVMDLCSGGELFDRWGPCRSSMCTMHQRSVHTYTHTPPRSCVGFSPHGPAMSVPTPPTRRIVAKGSYSEKDAAALIRDIVRVVAHCHSMGVMHRDLKPENFLLESRADNAGIKCTDFGLSVFFKPGQKFKEVVGSAYYVAPEVLKQSYSMEADIWWDSFCVSVCGRGDNLLARGMAVHQFHAARCPNRPPAVTCDGPLRCLTPPPPLGCPAGRAA